MTALPVSVGDYQLPPGTPADVISIVAERAILEEQALRDVAFVRPSRRRAEIAKVVDARLRTADAFPTDLLQVDGLLGEFMAECDRSAPERRQPIYALAMGLCLVGTLAGRRYKSETDLRTNLYAAILGESSSGKGHPQKVASRLLHEAELSRYLAGDYQSGNAITTELVEHPARLAIIDEFGIWLSGLTGERAPKHLADIKKKLMTLFSSAGDVISGSAYADTRERARRDIKQPHLCVFGAGTPEHFFNALQSGALRDGFIPRFLIFKPDEFLPKLVETPEPLEISAAMIEAAQTIAGTLPASGNLAGLVPMRHDEAAEALLVPFTGDGRNEHGRWTDKREAIMQGGCVGYASKELVGKWREHAIKLAMCRAISRNPATPEMDLECVAWGWRVAEWCLHTISAMADRHIADNLTEANNKRVRSIIADAGGEGIVKRDLIQRTRFLDIKAREFILIGLVDGGEISAEPIPSGPKGGKPGVRYRAA